MKNTQKKEILREYPEWHKKPFKLTTEEISKPHKVIERFHSIYMLAEIRNYFTRLIWDAYNSDCPADTDYLGFRDEAEKFIEAVYVIHESGHYSEEPAKSDREKAMEQFIGILAHELDNQLTNVIGSIEGFESCKDKNTGGYSSDAVTNLDIMTAIAWEMLNVLRNMINTVRYSTGKLEMGIEKSTFQVDTFINECTIPFNSYKDTLNKKLEVNIPTYLNCDITTDKVKLKQIVYNLLHNAFKFSRPGATVILYCWSMDSDLSIQVTNQGPVIPQDEIDLIFEPYHTIGKGYAGTGIGLYICKLYTELLGGKIIVESNADRTAFKVTLYNCFE